MDPNEAKIFTAILVAAIILAIIIGYFIVSIIRHQRRNLALHKEKIQAEIITLENERKRIASDLHDELGPVLAAVKMQINSIETTADDTELVEKASMHLDNMLQRIREISNNLMPVVLVRKGFIIALGEYIENVNRTGQLHIDYHVTDTGITIENDKGIHLYRVAQEIITNAIRHGHAAEIKVRLVKKKGIIILQITDNGRGFDHNLAIKNGSGHGLSNIVSRVQILNGDVYVDSGVGKGAKFNIEIPE